MRSAVYGVVLAGLSLTACGLEPQTRQTGCCYYRCVGPRTVVFSSFYSDEQECEDIGRLRCEQFFRDQVDDPENPAPPDWVELDASVLVPVEDTDESLGQNFTRTCEQADPPPGFEDI